MSASRRRFIVSGAATVGEGKQSALREQTQTHEFATLMLIKDAPDQIELGRAELDTLLQRQLISLRNLASGRPRPHVTRDGDSMLKAVSGAARQSSFPCCKPLHMTVRRGSADDVHRAELLHDAAILDGIFGRTTPAQSQ